MNCPNCGAPLDAGAKFCNACGTSITQENTTQEQTSTYNNTPFFTPENNQGAAAKYFCFLSLLAVSIFGTGCIKQETI